jgi:hypothetical protein
VVAKRAVSKIGSVRRDFAYLIVDPFWKYNVWGNFMAQKIARMPPIVLTEFLRTLKKK